MEIQNDWMVIAISVVTALGGKELLMYIVKYQTNKSKDELKKIEDDKQHEQDKIDELTLDNKNMLNQLLIEVKEELVVKRAIELELREKYAECKTRLETLFNELLKNEK